AGRGQVQVAQVVQQEQARLGAPAEGLGRLLPQGGEGARLGFAARAGQVETVVAAGLGEAGGVFPGPAGDVDRDVVELVLAAVPGGGGQQVLFQVAFAVVQEAQDQRDALHDPFPSAPSAPPARSRSSRRATRVTRAAAVLNRGCLETGSQSVIVVSLAARPGPSSGGRWPAGVSQ